MPELKARGGEAINIEMAPICIYNVCKHLKVPAHHWELIKHRQCLILLWHALRGRDLQLTE